jgi:Leucine-rich repeat (LRR) protein
MKKIIIYKSQWNYLYKFPLKILKQEKECFADFANLEKVHLEQIGLVKLEQGPFPVELENLEELSLCGSELKKIESKSFRNLKKLKILELYGYRIKEIQPNGFEGLENLENLDLIGNNLSKIDANSFQHLKKLIDLRLDENRINKIYSNGFCKGLENLEELDLWRNRLTMTCRTVEL